MGAANFFFQFKDGNVTARKLATTPDEEAWTWNMCPNPTVTKNAILKELFGRANIDDAKLDNIKLSRHSGIPMKPKTVKSLSQKYFSIPEEDLWYYPNLETLSEIAAADDTDDEDLTAAEIGRRKQAQTIAKRAKRKAGDCVKSLQSAIKPKPGRPKNAFPILPGQKSILKCVQKK